MRIVYICSDGTGITAEKFAVSLLAQFAIDYEIIRLPFIDDELKAQQALTIINQTQKLRPLIFTTLVNASILQIIHQANALVIDLFKAFMHPLSQELQQQPLQAVGLSHHMGNLQRYESRMQAIQFSMQHDDGQSHQQLHEADIILIGVSRSGKTPTSLYLAMQHGLKVANYPLIPEDFERGCLPSVLLPYQKKLLALSIEADRLASIRSQRRPGSSYASFNNCLQEVQAFQNLCQIHQIKSIATTNQSIEEIATCILQSL